MRYELLNHNDFGLRRIGLIKANDIKPCSICGNDTRYIDYCTECRVCSTECMDEQNGWLNENCR